MDSFSENNSKPPKLEIRFFGQLKALAEQKGWPFPCYYELSGACTAIELAQRMDIPMDQIEGVFINGIGKPLDKGWVKPGDRVGFVPYGIPGPYRVHLGFYRRKALK